MVSNDPHYPLEIATNSEIRRVFILDRFGWHTFILIISMNGISATLCRLLGNHPWHSLDPRTQYLWARTTLIIINLFCFPRLHLYMPSIYWLATETEKNILREQEWRQTDRSEWKSVPPPPSTQQDPRCLPGGDQDILVFISTTSQNYRPTWQASILPRSKPAQNMFSVISDVL